MTDPRQEGYDAVMGLVDTYVVVSMNENEVRHHILTYKKPWPDDPRFVASRKKQADARAAVRDAVRALQVLEHQSHGCGKPPLEPCDHLLKLRREREIIVSRLLAEE